MKKEPSDQGRGPAGFFKNAVEVVYLNLLLTKLQLECGYLNFKIRHLSKRCVALGSNQGDTLTQHGGRATLVDEIDQPADHAVQSSDRKSGGQA